jgi:hypothetical protein
LQPIKGSDFQLLHTELEQWRQQETAKIKAAGLDREKELVRWGWKLILGVIGLGGARCFGAFKAKQDSKQRLQLVA